MNAKRLIVTFVFATILIAFVIWMCDVFVRDADRKNRLWKEKAAEVTAAVEQVNSRKLDIMILGTPVEAPKDLVCRRIYDLYEDSLAHNDPNFEHYGHVLIINDPTGEVPMNEDRIIDIANLVHNQGYILIYLGSARLPDFQKAGFFFDEYPEGTSSIIFWDYGRKYELGFADDPSVIPEVVREGLSSDRIQIFTAVMKLASTKESLQSEK